MKLLYSFIISKTSTCPSVHPKLVPVWPPPPPPHVQGGGGGGVFFFPLPRLPKSSLSGRATCAKLGTNLP